MANSFMLPRTKWEMLLMLDVCERDFSCSGFPRTKVPEVLQAQLRNVSIPLAATVSRKTLPSRHVTVY